MHKLVILGDSFSHRGYEYKNKQYFWASHLHNEFKDTHNLIVDSFPSRDAQTIIDNWIKLIPKLTENDIIIIGIPFFIRMRVPLAPKDYMIEKYDDLEIINRFITHHSWYITDSEKIYMGNIPLDKSELDSHINFFEHLYYENESIEKNYNEIIDSLYDLTPAKKYLFSWDNMKNQTDVIEYKNDICNKIGWKTLDDLYKETNGEWGTLGDFHWHPEFEITFGNYLIDKFKK